MSKSATEKARRRANGEGSIYPYRGRYRGAITWTGVDGIRQRRTVYGATQAEVRRQLTELRAELDRGIAPAKPTSVADFLSTWLEASRQRIRPSSWYRAEQIVRVNLTPVLGAVPIAKLTPSDVERLTGGLITSGSSPRTAQYARVILRRALADALRDGLVHRNVAALARPPHVPVRALRAGIDYLDTADLRRLITAAKVHSLGPLFTLAATTGLRQAELLGLAWPDVDTENATLTVRRALARSWDGGYALAEPKTARSRRTLNLPSAALSALDRQRDLQDASRNAVGTAWQDRDDLVFTDPVGRRLIGTSVTHAFKKLLGAAGLPSIPFHGLRHSAATAMLAAGVPLKVVSDQLGHSTITLTADRYAGVVPAQRREAAAAIDRVLGER